MPIPSVTVTGAQFNAFAVNIKQQSDKLSNASDLAQSGLDVLVALNVPAPEIDLLDTFYNHFQQVDTLDGDSAFFQVVAALNQHVINRGTVAQAGEVPADRLNRWLATVSLGNTKVPATYARISSGAGYIISCSNITEGC